MNRVKRAFYRSFVRSIRLYERVFLDFHVWGRENIPPGPKIYAANHITSHDPLHVMPVFTEPVHFIVGPGFQSSLLARLLDSFEQINALAQDGEGIVNKAVGYLANGESVGIAPEADIQEPFRLGRFYPGVARIYRKYPVPIIPVGLVAPKRCMREYPKRSTVIGEQVYRFVVVKRGTYCVNLGEPWMPECPAGSAAKQVLYITRGLRERIQALVEDVRQNKFWL